MVSKSGLTLILGGDTGVIRGFSDEMKAEPKCASFLKVLEGGDIVFVNFECTLTNYEYPERVLFTANKCDPTVAEDFVSIGVDIVSIAHRALDFGNRGLFDTISTLDKVGIKHVGAGKNLEEAMKEVVIEAKGRRIGFLGFDAAFASQTEARIIPSADTKTYLDKPGLAPIHIKTIYEIDPNQLARFGTRSINSRTHVEEKSLQSVVEKIKSVKDKVDFLVVGVHWGSRDVKVLEFQPLLGHAMIDAGADILVGAHPHRPHGVEIYKGRPIFYSLGNFLYHRTGLASYLGPDHLLGRVKIDGKDITKVEVIPILNDNFPSVFTFLGDLNLRDQMLEYLKKFDSVNQFGVKYRVHGKEIPIEAET